MNLKSNFKLNYGKETWKSKLSDNNFFWKNLNGVQVTKLEQLGPGNQLNRTREFDKCHHRSSLNSDYRGWGFNLDVELLQSNHK